PANAPPPAEEPVFDRTQPLLPGDQEWLQAFRHAHLEGELRVKLAPNSSVRVMRVVDDPRSTASQLAEAIQTEPALAAEVLRAANSALFRGRGAEAMDLQQAVVRVGQRQLKLLLLTVMLNSQLKRGPLVDEMTRKVWRHSLVTSKLAAGLAPRAGLQPEAAFMAGLFHDVGCLAILSAAQVFQNKSALPPPTPRALLEAVVEFGYETNATVMADWNFPEDVVEAVTHFRGYVGAQHRPLAALVALSNDLCSAWGLPVDLRRIRDLERHPALKVLELDPEVLPSREFVERLVELAAQL
ncbi:MAG: HDOD domain-containing protein, partial [Planctomycetota bacterium]